MRHGRYLWERGHIAVYNSNLPTEVFDHGTHPPAGRCRTDDGDNNVKN
jgi:hypothetical protein